MAAYCAAVPHCDILIVDDDEQTTHDFARMLRLEGYTVRTALTAGDGIAMVRARRPDAMLVDLRMPVVDGLGFLAQLQAIGSGDVPVAVVTGAYFVGDDVVAQLCAYGAVVKFKPLWLEDLLVVVRELLLSRGLAAPPPRSV